MKNDKFQILCVGAKLTSPKLVASINNDAKHSKQPAVLYTLSNVKLFKKCILDADILGSLVALGSDCVNLTQCQVSFLLGSWTLPILLKKIIFFRLVTLFRIMDF